MAEMEGVSVKVLNNTEVIIVAVPRLRIRGIIIYKGGSGGEV
jgi:hypothetical protein